MICFAGKIGRAPWWGQYFENPVGEYSVLLSITRTMVDDLKPEGTTYYGEAEYVHKGTRPQLEKWQYLIVLLEIAMPQ